MKKIFRFIFLAAVLLGTACNSEAKEIQTEPVTATAASAAFDKLPKGTVEDLMKPENKEKLQDILQYHVYVGSLNTDLMQDGQTLNQMNGGNITIVKKDGKVVINNTATIVASIPAANGMIHITDGVLLPPAN